MTAVVEYIMCYSSAFLFGMIVGFAVMLFIDANRDYND